MKFIIGLMNDEGRGETREIDSQALLKILAHATYCASGPNEEDGPIFDALTSTNPQVFPPKDYENACEQLGLLHGMIVQCITKENISAG